jgi:peptidyl-prolyl cis-trans isomerase D
VVAYEPARVLPLEDVRAKIIETLKRARATKLAESAASAQLARLRAGQPLDARAPAWEAARTVSRTEAPGMAPDLLEAVFAMPTSVLPAYALHREADGTQTLIRLSSVASKPLPDERRRALADSIDLLVRQQSVLAYLRQLEQSQRIERP